MKLTVLLSCAVLLVWATAADTKEVNSQLRSLAETDPHGANTENIEVTTDGRSESLRKIGNTPTPTQKPTFTHKPTQPKKLAKIKKSTKNKKADPSQDNKKSTKTRGWRSKRDFACLT